MTVKERTTPTISFDLKDGAGNALTPATMRMTLRDVKTGTIINGRDAVDVLNANGVTVAAGHVAWKLSQADSTLLSQGVTQATYRAWFDYEWGTGDRDHHALEFDVINEKEIPA